MSDNFYAGRYLATIEILKKHGLWNLDFGLLFMPIIQHCMPPPSIHKIHQLLTDLSNCEIDTDWAPHKALLKLKKEVVRHTHAPDLTSEHEQKSWGTDYAIAFGINRIAKQRYIHDEEQCYWPTKLKSEAIEEFVETVYENMGAEQALNKDDLYNDIYRLRDVLIVRYAEQYSLGIYGSSKYHIQEKQKHISNTLQDQQGFGNNKRNRHATPSFWENPPNTQFCIQIEDIEASTSSPKKSDPDESNTLEPNDIEFMKNNTQQRLNLFSERPQWVRNNVRSYADANQLSWGSILQYWEFLLTKGLTRIFKMSLICFLTGIHKKSWINGLASNLPSLDSVHLSEENSVLRYKLNGGAKDFFDYFDEQNIMLLPISPGLKLTLEAVKAGLKEESAVRSFNRRYSGPSPTLNNVCRSGHTLLRKTLKGETLAFIMSGRIPIEFKARSAYFATDSDIIQELFNNCLLGLKKEVRKRAKQYPLVSKAVADINERKDHCGLHSIGSQLASTNWHFGSFKFHPMKIKTIEAYIERTNKMVLYFYWMIQYSLATRPPGERTESYEIGDFWLHKDKDSDRYFESKVLLIPELLKEQKQQVHACITNLKSFAKDEGFNVETNNPESTQLCYYRVTQKKINQVPLLSSEAVKLSKRIWGLTPILGRTNAYRHQCASYIHRKLGENHADTWLGHHIDGWCYSAPESAANANILSDVLKAQNQWLEELGFHLIKNPLS
ncbi:MAG: hypothetical protein ACJAS1_000265 [Oleiphilaceae bacterium]|jgi:hypothetical protein